MTPAISLPENYRAEVAAVREATACAMSDRAATLAAIQQKRNAMLAQKAEIEAKSAAIPCDEVLSEQDALSLAACRLRLDSLEKAMSRLDLEASILPKVFLDLEASLLMRLAEYWRPAFRQAVSSALAGIEPNGNLVSQLTTNLSGLVIIDTIKNHVAEFGIEATKASVERYDRIFDRMLQGKVYLGDEEI